MAVFLLPSKRHQEGFISHRQRRQLVGENIGTLVSPIDRYLRNGLDDQYTDLEKYSRLIPFFPGVMKSL